MNDKLSEMQFDLFWMLAPDRGNVCVMTRSDLKQWSRTVWDKSREMHFKSIGAKGGKIGGKTTGSTKARSRDQMQKAVRARWDKKKGGE